MERLYDIPGKKGVILNATLIIPQADNPEPDLLKTRDTLRAFLIDQNTNVLGSLTSDGTNEAVAPLIKQETIEFGESEYRLNITYFLDLKLRDDVYTDLYLAIYPKEQTISLDRYILNGENGNKNNKLRVELTYAVYEAEN